jgi:hypothetical protein
MSIISMVRTRNGEHRLHVEPLRGLELIERVVGQVLIGNLRTHGYATFLK